MSAIGKLSATGSLLLLLAAAPPAASRPAPFEPLLIEHEGRTYVAIELPIELAEALRDLAIPVRQWREAFAVRTEASAASRPPGPSLFGDYRLDDRRLLFRPRLPLRPGDRYRASVHPGRFARLARDRWRPGEADGEPTSIDARLQLPPIQRASPRVVTIQPEVERVPENLLRAYVHFSTPMRPELATDYLRLEDDEGRRVPLPFVEVDGGLWDPNNTRLTLLFHPGRIKRGVAPHRQLGPPLRQGRRYRLVVEPGWPSATGEPLETRAGRSWRVTAADRQALTPAHWTLREPTVGSREPLRVEFDEALDSALAARLIRVERQARALRGEPRVEAGGRRWIFVPDEPWTADEHRLKLAPQLEDLAGNRLDGPFDRGADQAPAPSADGAELPFRPHL